MADTTGMSDAETASADAVHSDADHSDDRQDEDGHGHAAEPLGPPDYRGWGTAIGGGAIGVLVALALFAATQS